jgi:hypothetical protein
VKVLTPVFEVAVDLVGLQAARRPSAQPLVVGGERFAVFAAGADAARLPSQVGVERLKQRLRRIRGCAFRLVQGGSFPARCGLWRPRLCVDASMQACFEPKIQSSKPLEKGYF